MEEPGLTQVLEVAQSTNAQFQDHVSEALRVLRLPIEVSGLHYHPFGVFSVPLPRRTDAEGTWSRRLHVWHPDARPVGEASVYGVHTHTGDARSHVLVGSLQHKLYQFSEAGRGRWLRRAIESDEADREEGLTAYGERSTHQGITHRFPADHPHGVDRLGGLAVSLFEQRAGPRASAFTTWRNLEREPEELIQRIGTPLRDVQWAALDHLEPVSSQF